MKSARLVVCLMVALSLLGGSLFAQTAQLPSAIPSGTTSSGYGPYDLLNMGTALKGYKMLCFEAQPNSGQDTCWFRDYFGHLSLYSGSGSTKLASNVTSPGAGAYQGTTSVGITTTNFTALIAAASDILMPAGSVGIAGKAIKIHGDGVYTTAAASLLNAEVMLCQVSGCGSGTIVAPAGCAVVTTNQANVLANGQFSIDCTLVTTATVGASGTFMAKALVCAQLGAATTAADSCFQDAVTAVSAAVDETVNEFVNIAFKFSTSNAGNSAILHSMTVIEN